LLWRLRSRLRKRPATVLKKPSNRWKKLKQGAVSPKDVPLIIPTVKEDSLEASGSLAEVPASQKNFVPGWAATVDGVNYAVVGGRHFELPWWITADEALRNLHLEVDTKKYDHIFLPCTYVEYLYGVVPIVMSNIGKGVKTISGYNKDGDFDFVPNVGQTPFDVTKRIYKFDDMDWENSEGSSGSSGSRPSPLKSTVTSSQLKKFTEEVLELPPKDRASKLIELLAT